jgi:hypothetical protein
MEACMTTIAVHPTRILGKEKKVNRMLLVLLPAKKRLSGEVYAVHKVNRFLQWDIMSLLV